MPQILTDSILTIAQRIQVLLDANKASFGAAPGVALVTFGDQSMFPKTPAICVEPGRKHRDLQGVPDLTWNAIDTYILLYHSRVDRSVQTARAEAIKTAEDIERFLHVNHFNMQDALGNQIITYGMVTDMDPSYPFKAGTLYSAVQLTWTSYTKTSVRNPP